MMFFNSVNGKWQLNGSGGLLFGDLYYEDAI